VLAALWVGLLECDLDASCGRFRFFIVESHTLTLRSGFESVCIACPPTTKEIDAKSVHRYTLRVKCSRAVSFGGPSEMQARIIWPEAFGA
jgi:hypothetical protein